MNKLILFLVFVMSSFCANAQMNIIHTLTEAKSLTTINYFGIKKISEKFSMTYFGLANKNFAEGLVGATFSPTKYFTLGASIGVQPGSGFRTGQSLWIGKGKHSFLSITEIGKGKGNHWYRLRYRFQATEKFYTTLNAWRFVGIGPEAGYKFEKLGVTAWALPTYDFEFEELRFTVGVTTKL